MKEFFSQPKLICGIRCRYLYLVCVSEQIDPRFTSSVN